MNIVIFFSVLSTNLRKNLFHVVTWAMESLDTLRKDIWREHRDEARDFAKEHPREKGRPKADDKD